MTVIGTGIRFFTQVTLESRRAIEQSDLALHLVDPYTAQWIERINPSSQSLLSSYCEGESRVTAYTRMVERILAPVRKGRKVCAAFYGHPGVLVSPSHEAVRRARSEGYEATMLPGISTVDCLVADLGVDPRFGFQSFEATDFLIYRREFDPCVPLLLWQVDSIGNATYRESPVGPNPGVRVLADALISVYGAHHRLILYRAPQLPLSEPVMHAVALQDLPAQEISSATVLFVPAARESIADRERMIALGLGGNS